MKFKTLPTVIALLILLAMFLLTLSNNAAADGVDKLGFPFMFYFNFEGKSPEPNVLRHYFSYTYLIADIFIAGFFIYLTNLLFPLILNKNRLKQTAI